MAFTIRTVTDYKDCLDNIRQFSQKAFTAGAITAGANTGDGTIYGASAAESSAVELWTITCTTGGTNDVALFSVSGSVSGAQLAATAGVPYSIAQTSFCIVAGAVDFVATDSFTFNVTASTAEWVQDRWETPSEYELIQHGIGNGSDEIYVGIQTVSDSSTYWNFEQSAFTGYVSGNTFATQPGFMPEWSRGNAAPMQVYISFTSYRINFCMIPVEGSHEFGGAGWINSYASPSQWSMPNFSGGSAGSASATIGTTSGSGNFSTGTNLSILDGNDILTGLKVSPFSYGSFASWKASEDGFMRLYPATPVYEANDLITGELDGIYWTTPFVPAGGLLTALALIVGTLDDYGGSIRQVCGVTFRNVTVPTAGNISVFDLTGD